MENFCQQVLKLLGSKPFLVVDGFPWCSVIFLLKHAVLCFFPRIKFMNKVRLEECIFKFISLRECENLCTTFCDKLDSAISSSI